MVCIQQARLFKALAHPFRIRLVRMLGRGAITVSRLAALTHRPQCYVSQQLHVLRRSNLVTAERQRGYTLYRVRDPRLMTLLDDAAALTVSPDDDDQPDTWHAGVAAACGARQQNKDGGISMDDKFAKPWHGIPRDEIAWHPTVVTDRCIGCGLCVTSCGRQVYGFDYEQNVAVVVNPLNCMVGCTTCATICTQDAIEFPSAGYLRQLIKKRKVLRQTKEQLQKDRARLEVSAN